jgi:ABC-type transport system involved in cytochrome bd biosynthesis fused ATPase/permease subunit
MPQGDRVKSKHLFQRMPEPTAIGQLESLPSYAFQFVLTNLDGIRCRFAVLTAVRVVSTLLKFYSAYLLGDMISSLSSISIEEVVWWYLPVLLASLWGREFLDYFTRRYAEPLPTVYGDHVLLRFFSSILTRPSPQLFNFSKERLSVVVSKYVDHCRRFIGDWVWSITGHVVQAIVVVCVLFTQSPWVLLANLFYVVFFLTFAFRLSRQFSSYASAISEAQINAGALCQNALLSYNFISRSRLEVFILNHLSAHYGVAWQAVADAQSFHAYRWLIQLSLFNTLYVGTLCFGLFQVKQGFLPLGFLVLIKWSFDGLWGILVYCIEYYVVLVQQREDTAIMKRELLPLLGARKEDSGVLTSSALERIEWRDVRISFGREGHIFSLSIPRCSVRAGEKVGVRGPSGSGKSTLFASVLSELPVAGLISWNDEPLHNTSRDIALLSGTDTLFKLSLRDNIVLGRDISDVQLHDVMCGCCIDELLPQLDVVVGSPSFNLSTGQEQRVKLARTLLQPASCYLLDEPFNGIDRSTKERIKTFIKEYLHDKAVFISSHIEEDLDWVSRLYAIESGVLREVADCASSRPAAPSL